MNIILKGHSTIDCPKEIKPDVTNTIWAARVRKLKILQRLSQLIIYRFCHSEILQFFKTNYYLNITQK